MNTSNVRTVTQMTDEQIERLTLTALVRAADDERIRLILKIAEADLQSLEAALSAFREERDTLEGRLPEVAL